MKPDHLKERASSHFPAIRNQQSTINNMIMAASYISAQKNAVRSRALA
jgi:hypothetical protein